MTPEDRVAFKRLCADPTFLAFAYRMIVSGGVFSSSPSEGRDFAEGRRSLALEILAAIDETLPTQSPDGVPIFGSIQMLTVAGQFAAKEKTLGRRSDPYRDLSDDAGSTGSGAE